MAPSRPSTPLIGITTYPADGDGRVALPRPYVDCVRRAGGDVVLIPPGVVDTGGLLDRLDGLVLAGGGDVDPAHYGGVGHETVYAIDDERDRGEMEAVRVLLERAVPTLAICRGSQVVNVALGGSLITHLPDAPRAPGPRSAVIAHRIEPAVLRGRPEPTPHRVTIEADSLLARLSGTTVVDPLSWHHQAVDRLGSGLRVVGRAPDGTIEATEHADHPWLVSVQWHPELTAAHDPTQQALFDGLVDACRARRVGSGASGPGSGTATVSASATAHPGPRAEDSA